MTQRFSLYEDLSIAENLDFVARLYAMDRRRERVAEALERLGLANRSGPARRRALGRLEAAPGARRLPDARAASCCCSTSPPPASTPRRGASSGTRSTGWPPTGMTVLVCTHYMDEAERCHRIAYISYGKLLAEGTVERGDGALPAWSPGRAEGQRLDAVADALRGAARASSMVAPFGATLHVSGTDAAALEAAIAPLARRAGPATGGEIQPRWRTCSST